MPDIAMCRGESCPIRIGCYRYRAVPNLYRQSYFGRTPYDHQEKDCDRFLNINDVDTRNLPLNNKG
ncbi:hypothetical protein [Thalassotalea sp. SU-HH00458]|uniref:hypothetical protein n=1 Tax=Thalassotalea sp. SU-HH00458 TaxID=3127657 RepID=UPI00310B692E